MNTRLEGECPIFSLPSNRHIYILLIVVYTLYLLKNTGLFPRILSKNSLNDTYGASSKLVYADLLHC